MAATNRDLRAMMKAGQFREDLFYRLSSAALRNSTKLRERATRCDPVLRRAFCRPMLRPALRQEGCPLHISSAALAALGAYTWPGNVRELAHVIENAVLMTDSERLSLSDLPAQILSVAPVREPAPQYSCPEQGFDQMIVAGGSTGEFPGSSGSENSQLMLDHVIKKALVKALEQTQGNRRRAADLLGVSRSTRCTGCSRAMGSVISPPALVPQSRNLRRVTWGCASETRQQNAIQP